MASWILDYGEARDRAKNPREFLNLRSAYGLPPFQKFASLSIHKKSSKSHSKQVSKMH